MYDSELGRTKELVLGVKTAGVQRTHPKAGWQTWGLQLGVCLGGPETHGILCRGGELYGLVVTVLQEYQSMGARLHHCLGLGLSPGSACRPCTPPPEHLLAQGI